MATFPELTSFGTLFQYALALEETQAANLEAAINQPDLVQAARTHQKRRQQLERLRRERLNEVVLQAISGMEGARYLPQTNPAGLSEAELRSHLAEDEERAAAFYEDAANIAAEVLGGLDRTFRKMAAENRALVESFRKFR